jgi:hypothetical protein
MKVEEQTWENEFGSSVSKMVLFTIYGPIQFLQGSGLSFPNHVLTFFF